MRLFTHVRLCPAVLLTIEAVVFAIIPSLAAGATLRVCASGCEYTDLQVALDRAQPGDTILLRAGETYTGNFVLPKKAGDSAAFILIRSDAPDTAFPDDQTRLVPDGYTGSNTARTALARLKGQGGQWRTTPVLMVAPGAHHYILKFLDFDGVAQEGFETLVELGTNSPQQASMDAVPRALVLDRVFIHGHDFKGQKRCLAVNGADVQILNSFIVNCTSYEFDAQAIAGFNGPGPVRIVNNYLEGSGENLMFGGANPFISGLVPSDIEIRRNHFSKPVAWRDPILAAPPRPSVTATPGGALQGGMYYFTVVALMDSGPGVVASRPSQESAVAVDAGSVVSVAWDAIPGADRYRVYVGLSLGAQDRYVETPNGVLSMIYTGSGETWEPPPAEGTRWAVKNLLELKNAQRVVIDGNVFEHLWPAAQSGYAILFTPRNDGGIAPWSVVRDVTFTNNILRHVSGGINLLGEDDVYGTAPAGPITIRNNLVYDVSPTWGGTSNFMLVTESPFDVTIDHNTIMQDGMILLADSGATSGFVFTNNVVPHNTYGIFGSGFGTGNAALQRYFPNADFRRNALGGAPAHQYPADNFFPDIATFLAQFVGPAGQDFRLRADSVFRGAGTDGKDLGVDFATLLTAVRGVVAGEDFGTPGTPPQDPASPTIALPGVIQAEDFDSGGEGTTYHDLSAGNSGGVHRNTDVDIAPANDAGGGYTLGWAGAGEWLQYTVNVATAGTYDIEVRVASFGQGGTFHIEVNGVDKTGAMTVPDTGGWQTWITLRRQGIALNAGSQALRLVLDTNGPGGATGNFNWIAVNRGTSPVPDPVGSTSFGGVPARLPGVIEAENFDDGGAGVAYHDHGAGNNGGVYRNADVDIAIADDITGAFTLGWVGAGEWLKYTIDVAATGVYDLRVRVASSGPGGTFHVEVDGIDKTGPITVPDTGGWQNWTTISFTGLALSAGRQVWRVVMDANGPSGAVGNFNFIEATSAAGPAPGDPNRDIVLYSSDVTTILGNWSRVASSSGAGSQKMKSQDFGSGTSSQPLASPGDYFEMNFTAEPNRPYRIWIRMRAAGDSKFNESIWLQFTGAVDASGNPLWAIGSERALLVNLEDCFECGVDSWGWQNRAWWVGEPAVVTFPAGGVQTLRIQTREDGVEIDQVVLSPITYFETPPGAVRGDTVIVPKQ